MDFKLIMAAVFAADFLTLMGIAVFRARRMREMAGRVLADGRMSSVTRGVAPITIVMLVALAACAGDAPQTSAGPAEAAPEPRLVSTPTTPAESRPAAAEGADATGAAEAANAFLEALTPDQRSQAVYDFDSPLRPNWSNLPAGMTRFERNGVRIGNLGTEQAALMHAFLERALSPDGYSTVVEVVGAEAVLASSSRAGRMGWSADNYWLAFFGEPSSTNPWGWQFGGHHLAVNVTVIGGRSYLSPTLVAVEPASYDAGGYTAAPLAAELESGLALFNSLADDRRSDARLTGRPREMAAGAGQDGYIPPLEGSKAADWSGAQRSMLMDTVALWVGLLPEASAQTRLSEIRADLDETYFAWHGDPEGKGSVYYRIQGPTLIVEFSTQGNLGGDSGHYHSIYRDPSNEYGARAAGGR